MGDKSKVSQLRQLSKKYDDNEQVKYGDELDSVPFKNFTAVEMNLFFSIVSQMKDKGTDIVRFSFRDLKTLSRYSRGNNLRFYHDLKKTYNKMLHLTIFYEDGHIYRKWVLFDEFTINKDAKYVDIGVNPRRKYVLNNLSQWTRFSLQQFNRLSSSYAKTIFRLCKKLRTLGIRYLSVKRFKEQLGIPKSYKSGDIDRRILKPAKKELKDIWPDFDYGKRKSKKRGNKLLGYYFVWNKEAKNNKDILNSAYQNDFASDKKKKHFPYNKVDFKRHRKTSYKNHRSYVQRKEIVSKIGQGKKLYKTSNEKARKALADFKNKK